MDANFLEGVPPGTVFIAVLHYIYEYVHSPAPSSTDMKIGCSDYQASNVAGALWCREGDIKPWLRIIAAGLHQILMVHGIYIPVPISTGIDLGTCCQWG